ncbi:MAG: glycosyltransferase family 4 protein [Pirellulaceae bacterium]
MKILFINPAANLGGAERVLLASLQTVQSYLTRDVHLLTLEDGPLIGEAERLGVRVHVVRTPQKILQWSEAGQLGAVSRMVPQPVRSASHLVASMWPLTQTLVALRKQVQRIQPSLVCSNGMKTHLLTAAVVRRDIPKIWHLHDFIGQRPLACRLLRQAVCRNTFGVAVSHAVRNDWQQHVPGLQASVVHNGTDVQFFRPQVTSATLQNAPQTTRIGLVATYAHWKGHGLFLDAVANVVRQANRNIACDIVGGPIYSTVGSQISRTDLLQRIQQLNLERYVRLVDFQNKMDDVYRNLDVVVHASTRPEPFGLTIVEAMASGCGVIASAAGGVPEIVTHEHDSLAVPPNCVDSLSASLGRLISDDHLRRRLGREARETVIRRFSNEQFAVKLANIYRQALSPQNAPVPNRIEPTCSADFSAP